MKGYSETLQKNNEEMSKFSVVEGLTTTKKFDEFKKNNERKQFVVGT